MTRNAIALRKRKAVAVKPEPKPRPSLEEMQKAWEIVDAYLLHFYQLLYFAEPKLTEPGRGRPFNVTPSPEHHHCIKVECQPWSGRRQEFDFLITPGMSDETVLNNCKAILEAIAANKQKVNNMACCALAVPTNCVCAYSFKCQLHGEAHHGTHD